MADDPERGKMIEMNLLKVRPATDCIWSSEGRKLMVLKPNGDIILFREDGTEYFIKAPDDYVRRTDGVPDLRGLVEHILWLANNKFSVADKVAYWLERVLIDSSTVRWKPDAATEFGKVGWYPSATEALKAYRELRGDK